MLSKTEKRQLKKLRKSVEKEMIRLRLTEPRFSVHCDYRTKKIKLVYSIYEDRGIDLLNNRIVRKKQKDFYLKNIDINDEEVLLINLPKYTEQILNDINTTTKRIGNDKDTLTYWAKVYVDTPYRRGNIQVAKTTLIGDEFALQTLIDYIKKHEPEMINIWKWVGEGRECLLRYYKYMQTIHINPKTKKGWSDTTVATSYGRVRAFFNYLPLSVDQFPMNLLNKLPIKRTKVITTTFTPTEMEKIKQFIKDYEHNPLWEWFIPMLLTMIETGCRISEVVNMKLNDVEPVERRWKIIGKGQKERYSYLKNDNLWNYIEKSIYTKKGKLRTDKKYVFHRKYYNESSIKEGDLGSHKPYYKEWKSQSFSTYGVCAKFRKMRDLLKLDEKLTPHSCRRYFITEMLKKTNGNIPLVAQLVGHNTWDVVRLYTKNVVSETDEVNVGIFN